MRQGTRNHMRTRRFRAHQSDNHRVLQSSVAQWGTIGMIMGIIACGPSGPDEANTPSAAPPSPTAPSPPPPTGDNGEPTLSGTAYEHSAAGTRPLGGVPLRVIGVTGATIDAVTDAKGQYEVALDREYAMVGARPQDDYLSPCSAQMHQWTSPLDVHVVSRGNLLAMGMPRSMPPFVQSPGYAYVVVLSGYVTERTESGRRPIAEASVEHFYGGGESGDPSGFTLTNAEGYYVLCGYWDDYGQSVRVHKAGYRESIQEFGSSVRIDFELTPE